MVPKPSTPCLLTVLLVIGGCGPPIEPSPEPDGGTPEDLPPCTEPATLYELDASDNLVPLGDGDSLGVTLGFQGFLFARVILRSTREPRPNTPVFYKVKVEGLPDQSQAASRVRTVQAPDGHSFDTGPVLIFFNDPVLAELVGKPASVRISGSMDTCRVVVQLAVTLRDGGRQDPDGGISPAGDR